MPTELPAELPARTSYTPWPYHQAAGAGMPERPWGPWDRNAQTIHLLATLIGARS